MIASAGRWLRVLRRIAPHPRSLEERNRRLLYTEIAWFGITNGIAATFTSVFAVRLGASNQWLGFLVSLPALVGILWQLPAARLVERQPHRMRVIVLSLLAGRLGFLAIAALPWLFPAWQAQALVAMVVLMAVPATVGNISFTSMMADVVPPEARAGLVSTRLLLIYVTTAVTILTTGPLLDLFPFPANYQGAFLVAFVASLLSLAGVARIRIPGDEAGQPRPTRPPIAWCTVLSDLRFRRFLAASLAVNLALFVPAALFAIYRVRTLQASDTWVGLLGTVETGVGAIASYLWGRQAARRGDRAVLLMGVVGLTLFPLLTALSPRVEPLLFVAVIGGLFVPAYSIGLFNSLLAVCPEEGRPTYVGVYSVLANTAMFVAPLAGTLLADYAGIRAALLVSTALRLASAAALAWWMRAEGGLAPALRRRIT